MNDLEKLLETRYNEICELLSVVHDRELQSLCGGPSLPTIKASLFLLFYNLVECIVYKSFELVFDEIKQNCLDFCDLIVCVQNQYKKYNKKGQIDEEDLLALDFSEYIKRVTLFSGNLDARAIRGLLDDWGITNNFHSQGENKLLLIKNYRNALAHGERSFRDVGRTYTIQELSKLGEILDQYLHSLIIQFNHYIEQKAYLAVNSSN